MAEPSPDKDAEVNEILSDLNNILSDLSGGNPAEAEQIAKAASVIQPTPPAAAPTPTPAPPTAPAPAAAAPDLKIELAPREGTLPPKKKEAEPPAASKPKPALATHPSFELSSIDAAAAPAASAPTPAAAPAPAPVVPAKPAAAPAKPGTTRFPENVPGNTPKDQIRRVSIIHSVAEAEHCDMFVAFVDQSALTISKKPLYLRKVHSEVFGPKADAAAVVKRVLTAKAVAVLALLQGIPPEKVRELAEECQSVGLSFRSIESSEVQKRSVAVDIMVDLMLLPGED